MRLSVEELRIEGPVQLRTDGLFAGDTIRALSRKSTSACMLFVTNPIQPWGTNIGTSGYKTHLLCFIEVEGVENA